MRNFADQHRSATVMIGMTIASVLMIVLPKVPPLSLVQNESPWFDAFANAGVYVLLAMGLNVVIGLAGLLDLGYAAFFAIGSYVYAYSNSPFSGLDLPFLPMLLVGAAVAAVFGIALGAPTLRLRGDYLAIMTLGFGEIVPIVFLNLDTWTQGTNGIGGDLPTGAAAPARRVHGGLPVRLHDPHGVHRDHRDGPPVSVTGFASRQSLERRPRGRARGGGQRHQHGHHEAARVRRWARRRPGWPASSTPRS